MSPSPTTSWAPTESARCARRSQAANTDLPFNGCPAGDGWDTISLPAGTYNLTLDAPSEDANASGDLDIITRSVTIRGAGAATTIIDGNEIDRVLDVLDEGMLLLEDVTVTKGKTTGKDLDLWGLHPERGRPVHVPGHGRCPMRER